MPELPEVETIRRGLLKRIVDKKIVDLSVYIPKSFFGDSDSVIGVSVLDIVRRAKVIAIKLENGKNLLFHLKMTGQLIYRGVPLRPASHVQPRNQDFSGGHPDHNWHAKLPNNTTAIEFSFEDGSKLYFNDLRKFGWCKVLNNEELKKVFEDYGAEPFDGQFDTEYLLLKASKIPNRNIKQFLTDQEIIAGIGNIYVDESLFDAKILPTRKVRDISKLEWLNIIQSVKKILQLGILHGGTTDSDYVNAEGEKGGMQDYLKVYRKAGMSCANNCGGMIMRMSIGGRGTHYCAKCQK